MDNTDAIGSHYRHLKNKDGVKVANKPFFNPCKISIVHHYFSLCVKYRRKRKWKKNIYIHGTNTTKMVSYVVLYAV